MSIEIDLCEAIVTAINAAAADGTFALPVTARFWPRAKLDYEGTSDVVVFVLAAANLMTPGTLDGELQNIVTVSVVVARNLRDGGIDELKGLLNLTADIVATIETDVDSATFDFLKCDANPLYDHDAYGRMFFEAERQIDWRRFQ